MLTIIALLTVSSLALQPNTELISNLLQTNQEEGCRSNNTCEACGEDDGCAWCPNEGKCYSADDAASRCEVYATECSAQEFSCTVYSNCDECLSIVDCGWCGFCLSIDTMEYDCLDNYTCSDQDSVQYSATAYRLNSLIVGATTED